MKPFGFITKDIKFKNEPKKAIVSVRLLYIIILIAFILDVIWTGGTVLRAYGPQVITLLVIHVILFILTYHFRTTLVLIQFNVYLSAWILLMIPCFGWDAGLQNFLMIMVMLFFFATHVKLWYKLLFSLIVFAARVFLVFVFSESTRNALDGSMPEIFFEVTNFAAVFVSVVLFCYLYSKDSTAAENKLMKYNKKLEVAASTDPLTGVYNRRYTYEMLEEMMHSDEVTSTSIAMGDIDFFKKVNDTYGHDAGDEVLRSVTRTMKEEVREDAIIARWGGEEFLLVFPNINGDMAWAILSRVLIKIRNTVIRTESGDINITMTFGLTELDFAKDIDHSVKQADDKLYIGKNSGRNQIVY